MVSSCGGSASPSDALFRNLFLMCSSSIRYICPLNWFECPACWSSLSAMFMISCLIASAKSSGGISMLPFVVSSSSGAEIMCVHPSCVSSFFWTPDICWLLISMVLRGYAMLSSISRQFSAGRWFSTGMPSRLNSPSSLLSGSGIAMSFSGFMSSCRGGGGGRSSCSSNLSSIPTSFLILLPNMSHSHLCSSFGWSTTAHICGSSSFTALMRTLRSPRPMTCCA